MTRRQRRNHSPAFKAKLAPQAREFGPACSPCDTCTRGDYPGLGEGDKAYNAVIDEILGKGKR